VPIQFDPANNSYPYTVELTSDDFETDDLAVRRLKGHETISQLYELELELASVNDEATAPEPSDLVGASVQLAMSSEGAQQLRTLHGIVAEASVRSDVSLHHAVITLRIVPHAWKLSLFQTQEVFVDHSVPDIIEAKLGRLDISGYADLRLTGTYPTRELVVQYQETDLAFVSRLCEHVGISFYFEHGDEHESMVFTDYVGGWLKSETALHYQPEGQHNGVHEITTVARAIPRVFMVHDYNYRTPDVDLSSVQQVDDGYTGGVVEYGSHHKSPAEGTQLAQVRANTAASGRVVHNAVSGVATFGAGVVVSLDGHSGFEGQDLLVTQIEHELTFEIGGAAEEGDSKSYENRFVLTSTDTPYHPPRRTARPRVDGIVSAIVQPGAAGETGGVPMLDQDGRYLVRFHFDTSPLTAADASQRVRMAQPFVSGGNNGMHFPLRRGTEVLLAFIDGNPDRPIIIGAVPNAANPATITAQNAELHKIKTDEGLVIQFGKGR
jgi:type VI secretion system secreted protein VgrG